MSSMTSRERILAAFQGQDVDYLPCSVYFNPNLRVQGFDCSHAEDRVRLALDLGTDPVVDFGIPHSVHPEVKTRCWKEEGDNGKYPLLWQAWDTPEGRLTQAVRITPEIRDWQEIHLDDHAGSNIHKPLLETPDDVRCLKYIFVPPTDADLKPGAGGRGAWVDLADRYDLPVRSLYGMGLALLLYMMGAQNAVYFAMDYPDAFNECAQIIHRAEMRKIEFSRRAGAHILKRFGGYEMTNFYNPEIFRRVVMPCLKREVEYAHELGLLIYYRIVTGMEPLLEDIASIGFDCIEGGEPCLSNCTFEEWHTAFGRSACSWTGISSPVLLGGSDEEAVRTEVRHAVDVFGRRNFILGVTNSIRSHFNWQNTLAMIDEWKSIRLGGR